MADERREKEEEKAFVIRDRRFSAQKEEGAQGKEKTEPKQEPEAKERGTQGTTPDAGETPEPEEIPQLGEINLTNFLLSISTSALIQLGEVPDPVSKKHEKQLPIAKQTIDLIALLKEKTKGNLTPDEEKLIEYLLYDLRMRYVKAAG